MSTQTHSRRNFLKTGTIAAAGMTSAQTFAAPSALGANEKMNIGFIGLGNRGTQLLTRFMDQSDVNVAALCDVYEPYRQRSNGMIEADLKERLGGRIPNMDEGLSADIPRYVDFRKLLEQKNLDAVVIATPDHWHAVQTIMACDAGLDVYVEKPASITIHEGRKMVEAANRNNRVVQVGTHRRSSKMYAHVHKLIQDDRIGKVSASRAFRVSNMYPHGIGQLPKGKKPEGLDWDLWLGPRPMRPAQENLPLYQFRWWESYSSQVANWGVHFFDAIRWMLDVKAPVRVSAMGGRYAVEDDRTIPDTMQVTMELPNKSLVVFGIYEASGGKPMPENADVEFRGTLANLYAGINNDGYKIIPSHGGQFQPDELYTEFEERGDFDGDLTVQHIRNFLDCMKSRNKPNADMETGHRSTTFSHLSNMALATRETLVWDAEKERVTNHESANDLLHYEYREPWSLG